MIAERVTNSIGTLIAVLTRNSNFKTIDLIHFIPKYFEETKEIVLPSLEQQQAGWGAFRAKYKALKEGG